MVYQKKLGQVKQLFISSKENSQRILKETLSVDISGIHEDKFYSTNNDRAILLTSTYAYELMKQKDIIASYGALGENILVDFNPYNLDEKTQLYIGDAILEITIECTVCDFLTKINNKVPKLLKKDRGVFAKVIKNGSIKLGDVISIH